MSKAAKGEGASKKEDVPGTALLSKALNILECIGESEGRPRINDIANATGYSKPTLYRILSALSHRGFVQIDPRDNAYTLGHRFTELAGAVEQHSDLISLASGSMQRLSQKFGEAVSLGVLSGNAQQTVASRAGAGAVATTPIGTRKPLYCTALGKALLGHLPRAEAAKLMRDIAFEAHTASTHTDAASLEDDLSAMRMRGFALDNEEIVEGVKCVAVPILDADNKAVAAISVSAPAHRMPDRRRHEIALELMAAAREVGKGLGSSRRQSPSSAKLPAWLNCVDGLRAFGIAEIQPLGDGAMLVADGPGGVIHHIAGNTVRRLATFAGPVHGICLARGVLLVAAGDALWRLEPSAAQDNAPIKLVEGAFFGTVEALSANEQTVFAAAGAKVWRIDTGNDVSEIFEGRVPGSGMAQGLSGPLVMTEQGLVEIDAQDGRQSLRVRVPADGVRAFAAMPDGSVFVSRSEQWSLERYDVAGRQTDRLPLPVPTASALCASGMLWVGTERWPLSSAQLELAPLAGSLFAIDPSHGPLRNRQEFDREEHR